MKKIITVLMIIATVFAMFVSVFFLLCSTDIFPRENQNVTISDIVFISVSFVIEASIMVTLAAGIHMLLKTGKICSFTDRVSFAIWTMGTVSSIICLCFLYDFSFRFPVIVNLLVLFLAGIVPLIVLLVIEHKIRKINAPWRHIK